MFLIYKKPFARFCDTYARGGACNTACYITKDMERAFIEITDDKITVTDFYFGIRREKTFSLGEIECAEITTGYSMRVRGYRHSGAGCTYIVFRDKAGNYMFKLICVPETKQYFRKYLD